jgi:hypothetical protein
LAHLETMEIDQKVFAHTDGGPRSTCMRTSDMAPMNLSRN